MTEFEELKSLLVSNKWPPAVSSILLCNPDSNSDKTNRANGLLSTIIKESIEGKKFLDFGCGEGHVTQRAKERKVTLSVGYDIVADKYWESSKALLTTNINEVEENGPYDIILLLDVIDHTNDPLSILLKCRELLHKDGTIYMRAHPFCSKHGAHLYRKFNKAYMQLVFTKEELKELGCETSIYEALWPMRHYEELINKANLKIAELISYKEAIEKFFFDNKLVNDRMKIRHGQFPKSQCEHQFVDYIIKRKAKIPL